MAVPAARAAWMAMVAKVVAMVERVEACQAAARMAAVVTLAAVARSGELFAVATPSAEEVLTAVMILEAVEWLAVAAEEAMNHCLFLLPPLLMPSSLVLPI